MCIMQFTVYLCGCISETWDDVACPPARAARDLCLFRPVSWDNYPWSCYACRDDESAEIMAENRTCEQYQAQVDLKLRAKKEVAEALANPQRDGPHLPGVKRVSPVPRLSLAPTHKHVPHLPSPLHHCFYPDGTP